MDNIDQQLIALLRQDARISISQLAKKLNIARATVQHRMDKLKQQGIITGFTVLLSNQVDAQQQVRAIMSIALDGNCAPKVKAQLQLMPSVVAIHSTNGRWDLVIELETDTLAKFDQTLGAIRNIIGIKQTETSILLSSRRFK